MMRLLGALFCILWSIPGVAQDLRALARVDQAASVLEDTDNGLRLGLALNQAVPFRVFTLDDPRRVVLEFREVAFEPGIVALDQADRVSGIRAGRAREGWSRLSLELAGPMVVTTAWMETEGLSGGAMVHLEMVQSDAASFAETARLEERAAPVPSSPAPRADGKIVVALDPGHGGVDPGAQREGVDEADLMLTFAVELRETLLRSGNYDVVLTRESDRFVSLPGRVTIARQAGAHMFLSLHADALAEGRARGVTIYTLSDTASDAASAALSERQDRADIVAGIDLTGDDDGIASVLIDLARAKTAPRTHALADELVVSLREALGRLHKRPRLSAGFSVLKAPDIPSVLLELGFMSSQEDLNNLRDPVWRALAAEGIRAGLDAWAFADAAVRR